MSEYCQLRGSETDNIAFAMGNKRLKFLTGHSLTRNFKGRHMLCYRMAKIYCHINQRNVSK